MTLTLIPGQLTLAQLRALCSPQPPQVALDDACRPGIRASAALVRCVAAVATGWTFAKAKQATTAKVAFTAP